MIDGRPVDVHDYNEYRKLEDKRDRIMLKKTLYEKKKVNDESQIALLNDELNNYQSEKAGLNKKLRLLRQQLEGVKSDVSNMEKSRKKLIQQVEQQKRREIIRRSGKEVPYLSNTANANNATANARSRSQVQVTAVTAAKVHPEKGHPEKGGSQPPAKSPRDLPVSNVNQAKKRGKRGNQRTQQRSPRPGQSRSAVREQS